MPGPTYDSISGYSSNDRFSTRNTVKKIPTPIVKKKDYKSIERSRLAGIAKGGKWVLFALLFVPCFIFVGVPRWIYLKIWKNGARLTADAFAKAARTISHVLAKLIYPFVLLKSGMVKTANRIIRPIILLRNKAAQFGRTIGNLADRIVKLPAGAVRRAAAAASAIASKVKKIRPRLKLNLRMPKPVSLKKYLQFLPRLKGIVGKLTSFQLRIMRIKLPIPRLKIPSLPKFKFKRISLPTWKFSLSFPKIKFKIKLPKLKFNIKLPSIKIRFNFKFIKLPSVRIRLPKVKLPAIRVKKIDWDRALAPMRKAGVVLAGKTESMGKWIRTKCLVFSLVLNGISLLFGYWSEQVKEMLASSFRFE